ncbi:hypothetical protein HanIR_Chr14g0682821 [Helianthus annuus]|nr:hypothetical protein HanIR_Chr14g0682821 [Helianthus annuus]
MGKDWDKSHNIYCLLDAHYTDNTPFKVIAKFLRESKIHKALTDKTEVYESHVRRFWSSVRYERARRMICRIDNPAYVAPENDAWRHENSNSESEDNKMNEMIEKKLRYWFVKDGKRKRTPKTSPAEESTPKIVVKGPSKESQQRLVDEPVGTIRSSSTRS